MKKMSVLYPVFLAVLSLFLATTVHATNGMNLEGYGPVATGMGGASMAYDNGTAAMMNNPATLGLMPEGDRLDVALGYLGPHIKSKTPGESDAGSSSTAFYMPAFGWVKKSGPAAYGVGIFAQGGMGAEYAKDSFLAAGSQEEVRSELSVGRVIVPISYDVSKDLTLAATLDYVWAGLDLKMAMSGMQFADLATPGQQVYGTASGSLVNTFGTFIGMGLGVNYARFDFSNNSRFTGVAQGTGYAGKLGAVYKVNDTVAVGVTYHSKTWLGDMETENAKVSMNVDATAFAMPSSVPMDLSGKIQVKDFQWPQTIGAGIAYQASPELIVVFDYKWINWADVMDSFKMTFTADQSPSNDFSATFGPGADLRGQSMNATSFQKWNDQHVIMIGAGYKVSPEWTVRGGLNLANNPVPDKYLNPLFPAIEKNHVMLGAGYMISKASSVDASLTYAPEVKATNGQGVEVTHSQTNAQVMYSYRF